MIVTLFNSIKHESIMKTLKLIFAVAALLGATTSSSWGQSPFYGSIKFKNYVSQKTPGQILYDTITYSYHNNNVLVMHKTSSSTPFSFPEITVETDSLYYLQYKDKKESIQITPRSADYTLSATATNEFQTILKHRCQKYIVSKILKNGITLTAYWWLADDMKLSGNFSNKLSENSGCPLKYESLHEGSDGKLLYISTVEAVEIEEAPQPFDLPSFLKGKKTSNENTVVAQEKRRQ